MATKQRQQDDVEEQDLDQEDLDQEEQDQNGGGGALHVNVDGDTIVIELPRDGNEGETLSRLSQFVDGL